jgi:hydroxyethylthiazole kinase
LILKVRPRIIRGNASEILALTNSLKSAQKGVDSKGNLPLEIVTQGAVLLARLTLAVVAVSGETDIVTDGQRVTHINGGTPTLTLITGSGCILSALMGAFAGALPNSPYEAAVSTMLLEKSCGFRAEQKLSSPNALGEFRTLFIDALAQS